MNPFISAAGEGARTCTLTVSIDALPVGRHLIEIGLLGAKFDDGADDALFESIAEVHFERTPELLVTRELSSPASEWEAFDDNGDEIHLLHATRLRLIVENISGAAFTINQNELLLRGLARSPIPASYTPGVFGDLVPSSDHFSIEAPGGALLAVVETGL